MSHHVHKHDDAPPDTSAGYEKRDFSTRVVVIFGISLVVGAVVIHVLIWLLYVWFGNINAKDDLRQYPLARVGAPRTPPAPRLQEKPREELKQMRAEEDRMLNGYGWVDKQGGFVHIPIDRAMELALQRGFPVRQQMPATPDRGLPQDSSSGRTYASSPSGR